MGHYENETVWDQDQITRVKVGMTTGFYHINVYLLQCAELVNEIWQFRS